MVFKHSDTQILSSRVLLVVELLALFTALAVQSANSFECIGGFLERNEKLIYDQYICSSDGNHRFGLSYNGELALYSFDTKVWSRPNTCCAGSNHRICMQDDGNLVVYNNIGSLWASDTRGINPMLVIDNEGFVRIVTDGGEVLWSTGECNGNCHQGKDKLMKGSRLYPGQHILSANGKYAFGLTGDGEMALWKNFKRTWVSGNGITGNILKVQYDGNLVLYNNDFGSMWSTRTNGNTGAYLYLTDTGEVTVMSSIGNTLWTLDASQPLLTKNPVDTFPSPPVPPSTISQPAGNSSIKNYIPGDLNVYQNGLHLSTGLSAKIIARSREPVPYANGGKSNINFHEEPDGGAVFQKEDGSGWVYVSNSEVSNYGGGVGALTFDSDGNVISYEMLLTGTTRNCGGGKSPYGTWLTCEEDTGGQVWEVDPFNKYDARQTVLGGDVGGSFESVAYDNRNKMEPKFFVTEDAKNGALRRFTADKAVVKNTRNTWNILASPGKIDYLVMHPYKDDGTGSEGWFEWTSNLTDARDSASRYYPNTEGIDFRDGKLFFTAKGMKKLFILNVDEQTYEETSTQHGAFYGQPDQIASILNDKNGILYFCEEGRSKNGIHGRDPNGSYFTILEEDYDSETTGLAFSPDNRHMYVSFQHNPGLIFDVTRDDGLAFDGKILDIKYHE